MRTTQFIGLTKLGSDFIARLTSLPSDSHTIGLSLEEISLRKWDLPDWLNHNSAEGEKCIREVVQVCPWSSGPMIFTCLEIDFGKGFKQRCFEWINDPTVKNEYDYDGGRMWV